MITTSADTLDATFDVCVVGAGPSGIALALAAQARGLKVLLLEAGRESPTPGDPDILAADITDPSWHDPTDVTSACALGGTSHWWGGRSVPFEPSDFETWPIGFNDIAPWYGRAAEFLGAKGVHVSAAPGAFASLAAFDATGDETWCPEINMAKRWREQLAAEDGPTVLLGARVTGLLYDSGAIGGVRVCIEGGQRTAHARQIVLAGGGLGTLKLLLLTQRETPALFGGPEGPLGRGYMGHLTGIIADLAIADPAHTQAFAFRRVDGDVVARRRIRVRPETMAREGLPNVGFWIDNAAHENPAHGSAVASAKYLAARASRLFRGEGAIGPHLRNVMRAPFTAVAGLSRVLWLLASAKLTGHLPRPPLHVPSAPGMWEMRYHAEQRPDLANRVSLSDTRKDSRGLPALKIDFRFSDQDFADVVRAHELLDADLRESGAGRLRLRGTREEMAAMVADFARDGYHQLGGAVMSNDPARGVVDAECRAHGVSNLWIASSAVFPTGSHANPTLTIVALSLRIAERLAALRAAEPSEPAALSA